MVRLSLRGSRGRSTGIRLRQSTAPRNTLRLTGPDCDAGRTPGDVDGNGIVDFDDVLALLAAWGACGDPCPADLDGDGMVGFADLLIVLAMWS